MTNETPPQYNLHYSVRSIEQRVESLDRDSKVMRESVESIDRNVEEILDRLNEQLDELRYRHDYRGHGYNGEPC